MYSEIANLLRLRDGNGSVGQWVTGSDPLTHEDEITTQYLAFFDS